MFCRQNDAFHFVTVLLADTFCEICSALLASQFACNIHIIFFSNIYHNSSNIYMPFFNKELLLGIRWRSFNEVSLWNFFSNLAFEIILYGAYIDFYRNEESSSSVTMTRGFPHSTDH